MTTVQNAEREALLEADREISGLQQAVEAAVQNRAIDGEIVKRVHDTTRKAARRVNEGLIPEIEPGVSDEIRRRLIDIITLEGESPLDLADRALVETEAVRHVIRDLLDEQPTVDPMSPSTAVALLEEWLPSLKVGELAELLGLTPRQLQRIRKGAGEYSRRLEMVVKLVSILRRSWTDAGVYAWFMRRSEDFGNKAPIDLLDDVDAEQLLLRAVRAGRVQAGV